MGIKNTYYFIRDFIDFCLEKNLSRHAKGLSFSTVLAIIPLFIVFFGALASSPWISVAQEKVQALLFENFMPAQIGKIFQDYVLTLISAAGSIQIAGFIFLTITVIFLFLDIEDSFDDITTVGIKKLWYKRVMSIGSLFLIPLGLFIFMAIALTLFNASPDFLRILFKTLLAFSHGIQIFLFFALWGWFYFLYRVLPQKKIKRKIVGVCSGVGATVFVLAQLGFGYYLTSFSSYDVLYGVLAAIPVFLLWVFLNWQITLYPLAFAFYWEKVITDKQTPNIANVPGTTMDVQAQKEVESEKIKNDNDKPELKEIEATEVGIAQGSEVGLKGGEGEIGIETLKAQEPQIEPAVLPQTTHKKE